MFLSNFVQFLPLLPERIATCSEASSVHVGTVSSLTVELKGIEREIATARRKSTEASDYPAGKLYFSLSGW